MRIKKILSLTLVIVLLLTSFTVFAEPQKSNNGPDMEMYLEYIKQNINDFDKISKILKVVKNDPNVDFKEFQEKLEEMKNDSEYDPEEEVRVIVEVKGTPIMSPRIEGMSAQSQAQSLISAQQAVMNKIEDNEINVDYRHSYVKSLNGFSMSTKYKNIEDIKKIPGVTKVHIAKKYTLDMESSKTIINTGQAWEEFDSKGEGMLIAVIDTGINWKHKDFRLSDPSDPRHRSKEEVEGALKFNTTIQDIWYSDKVITGFDWADMDDDVIGDLSKPYTHFHGSHVAGTIAANGEGEFPDAVVGVAPEAQLLAEKVFSDESPYAYEDDIIAGILHSIELGADVINMSLGADSGFQNPEDPEQKAIELAVDNGILVAVSAGNSAYYANPNKPFASNPDIGLVGSPGTAEGSISVASYENETTTGPTITFDNDKHALYLTATIDPSKELYNKWAWDPEENIYDYVYCGLGGTEDDFEGIDLEGKVALIQRGEYSFTTKTLNAQERGAKAVIIYNHEMGGDSAMGMYIEYGITIPVISIGNSDGNSMKDAAEKKVIFDGTAMTFANPYKGEMSDFTSWGLTPNLEFKPEITAPGGNIYSTVDSGLYGYENNYENMSGTSMAAPHIAGASALVLNELYDRGYPKNRDTVELAKEIMMNTAVPVVDENSEAGEYYSPRRQGAGLVKIDKALETPAYIVGEDGKASLSLKEIGDSTDFTLTITSFNDDTVADAVYYDVFATILTDATYTEDGIEYLSIETTPVTGAILTLDGEVVSDTVAQSVNINTDGSSKVLQFNLDLSNADLDSESFVEGFIELVPTDANPELPSLTVPYAGFYGNWNTPNVVDPAFWDKDSYTGLTALYEGDELWVESLAAGFGLYYEPIPLGYNASGDFDLENVAFSPNGDWINDDMGAKLTLLRNTKKLKIYVEDSEGNIIKNIAEEEFIPKTSNAYSLYYDLGWDGTPDDSYDSVPDGTYYFVLENMVDFEGATPQTYKMPIKVDTEAPVINGDVEVAEISNGYKITWGDVTDNIGIKVYQVSIDNQTFETTDNYFVYESEKAPENILVTVEDYARNKAYATYGDNVLPITIHEIDTSGLNSSYPNILFWAETIMFAYWEIDIVDPSGNVIDTITTSYPTTMPFKVWLPKYSDIELVNGTYKAIFKAETEDGLKGMKEQEFEVYSHPIKINEVKVLDLGGNEIETTERGTTVQVQVDVENLTYNPIDSLVIVKVVDKSGKTVYMTTVNTKLNGPIYDMDLGEEVVQNQKITTSFTIPVNGLRSEYTVRAFVWDSWTNMEALSSVNTTSITVK